LGVPLRRTPWCISPIYFACRPCRGRDDERSYAERLDFGSLLRAAKHGAAHQPVWRIWRATRPMRWSMDRTICLCGSSCGLARPSIWPEISPVSPPRQSPAKSASLKSNSPPFLAAATECDLARQLQAKIGRAQDQLLIFCDYPGEVEATNNGSERKLRPCVIQRKVTNGYRAMWAAQAEADVRTTVDTARLKGANPFQTILDTLV